MHAAEPMGNCLTTVVRGEECVRKPLYIVGLAKHSRWLFGHSIAWHWQRLVYKFMDHARNRTGYENDRIEKHVKKLSSAVFASFIGKTILEGIDLGSSV